MSNRVDAKVTPEVAAATLTALVSIRTSLPMLVTIKDEERATLAKMGDKTEAFVKKALDTAKRHPEILSGKFDADAFQTDVELVDALTPIWGDVRELFQALDDTILLAGSEAFAAALDVYQLAKVNDKDGELTEALKDMGQRFTRKPRKPATDTPPAAA